MDFKDLTTILDNFDLIAAALHSYLEKIKPDVYSMGKDALGIYRDFVGCDEYFELSALHKKKIYDTLTKAGFTEEQAIQLMIADINKINRLINTNRANTKS